MALTEDEAWSMDIVASTARYDGWLRRQLGEEIVEDDLAEKHKLMCERPRFLRATYWRWAETILRVCPQLAETPPVLAVGDIHVENFGTWRDLEGRLIWGVNDFDEAARMPFALDIVRLATSARLATSDAPPEGRMTVAEICVHICDGYGRGLARPGAVVLDWQKNRFYEKLIPDEEVFKKFRDDYDPNQHESQAEPSPTFRRALKAARPDATVNLTYWRRRKAGGGSLGRPRWVGAGEWQGAPIVREAKAMVASGWSRVEGRGPTWLRCHEIAHGRYRSPDPWNRMIDSILVRRLSPGNRKLEFGAGKDDGKFLDKKMLEIMGCDLAAVHLGVGNRQAAVTDDFNRREAGWWIAAVEAAEAFVSLEHEAWSAKMAHDRQEQGEMKRGRKATGQGPRGRRHQ